MPTEARGPHTSHSTPARPQDWLLGSQGAWVSMGVHTGGGGEGEGEAPPPYGLSPGLVFSLPVTTERGGAWTVVGGLPARADAHSDAMLRATEAELLHERELAFAPPPPPRPAATEKL